MRKTFLLLILSGPLAAQPHTPLRPVHTYSIVAMDSVTGEIGVAVQSHWFNVGAIVTWAEPGVGAVATQSFVDPSYGPRGLFLMRTGTRAPEALAALLRADADSQVRQVAMIDALGNVAAHTGSNDIPAAGHTTGRWFSAQANLMRNADVWPAMARAFEETQDDLAGRLLAALEAAQAAGGDIRGKQSAALVVVSGDPDAKPWEKLFDLRVEDSPDPLGEMRRLLTVARAYRAATDGDNFMTAGKVDSALVSYTRAAEFLPDEATNGELIYWQAVTMADLGRVDDAIPFFRRAFAQDPSWIELLWRLPTVGLLRADSVTIQRIVREASSGRQGGV
ncbi:MAG: DUF1028 domain-containing protein [Gemmatimonadetes bacterium]|nr:DUF1028 domain-containing protein [Gemmatimonadota bacterium]